MKLDLDAISGEEVQAIGRQGLCHPDRIIQRTKQALETE